MNRPPPPLIGGLVAAATQGGPLVTAAALREVAHRGDPGWQLPEMASDPRGVWHRHPGTCRWMQHRQRPWDRTPTRQAPWANGRVCLDCLLDEPTGDTGRLLIRGATSLALDADPRASLRPWRVRDRLWPLTRLTGPVGEQAGEQAGRLQRQLEVARSPAVLAHLAAAACDDGAHAEHAEDGSQCPPMTERAEVVVVLPSQRTVRRSEITLGPLQLGRGPDLVLAAGGRRLQRLDDAVVLWQRPHDGLAVEGSGRVDEGDLARVGATFLALMEGHDEGPYRNPHRAWQAAAALAGH